MKFRVSLVAALLAVVSAGSVDAQNSVFGTRGLGFPTHRESARTVAMGGGPAMFDQSAFVNPAAVSLVAQSTVAASTGATFRGYQAGGVDVSGLQETRLPLVALSGRVTALPIAYQVGFASYLERTFAVTIDDTTLIDGNLVAVRDSFASVGGIADLRGTAAWTVLPQLRFGLSLHRMAGSSRLTARREFDDESLRRFSQETVLSFAGNGISTGMIWFPTQSFGLALTGRANGNLTATLSGGSQRVTPMPNMFGAGLLWRVARTLEWSASAQYRSWGRTQRDLGLPDTESFDTWEVGTGFELRRAGNVGPRVPIRVGLRYAQLPFSPTTEQPTETNLSFGTGWRVAGGLAAIDIAVEKLARRGAGVTEDGWYVAVGMTVTPSR